ncbi:reverse transcriptase domain-containing protein [Tanacetum coccineum]
MPGPKYPEYLAPSDEEVPIEDQPYVVVDSPIALSLGYVADSDPEEDSEDGPVDYPADGGDGDDDDSSDDDEEEEEASEEEEAEEEEEEHLAPADSVVAPVVDHVPSFEETEPFETDESAATPPSPPACHTTARISIRPEAPMPFPSEDEVERLLALPPPPLISLSPPSIEERLARCLAAPVLPSSPLPIVPHSLFIPPPVDHREDIPEAELPPRKRLCLTTLTSRYEVGESSTAAPRPTGGHGIDYGISSIQAFIPSLSKVTQGHFKLGFGFHYETVRLLDQEALASREALAHSAGLSSAVHYELQAYRTHTQMQDYHISSQESLMTTLIAQVSSLQGQLSVALGQIQALQAIDQTHADDPEGAASTNNMPPRRSSATARDVAARAAAAIATAATSMTIVAVEQLIEARVSVALANHETIRNSTNGHGDGSHNSDTGTRGTVRTPRECTNKDFLNCKPLTFKGTKGVVVLSQWFEKMDTVENQVKFATCNFLGNALTWWNSHMKTLTQDVAYAMDWKALKKMMTVKYCPKGEIKKLEIKVWNLKVKGTDVASYTLRFQELALMCGRMFHEESDREFTHFNCLFISCTDVWKDDTTRNRNELEKYVGGLPDMIRGNVMSYQPKTMEKATEFDNDQMDQKVLTIAERQAEQKRKLEFNAGNNQGHQQQNKRQSTGRAYTAGPSAAEAHFRGPSGPIESNPYHHEPFKLPARGKRYVVDDLSGLTIPTWNFSSQVDHGAFNIRKKLIGMYWQTTNPNLFWGTDRIMPPRRLLLLNVTSGLVLISSFVLAILK